jgi:hypothetical protein
LFCVIVGPKRPLHRHNRLSFSKFQNAEHFPIPCPRHVSSRLPPSGKTCKYAMAPVIQTNLKRFCLLICSFLLCLSLSSSEFPVGRMHYPVIVIKNRTWKWHTCAEMCHLIQELHLGDWRCVYRNTTNVISCSLGPVQ